jgi:hypothetical protein
MIAGDMRAMTDVSETAQELMSACEGAMTTTNCADTGSGAYDSASNEFEEASSQLGELGFEYEITSDGVFFSRSGTAVEEHGPATRTGAAPFLGLTGAVELGSLDQVIDVSDYKGLHASLPGPSLPEEQSQRRKKHLLQILRKSVQVSGERAALLWSAQAYLPEPSRRS